jgi:hypothetical protein
MNQDPTFEPRLGSDVFGAALSGDRDQLDGLLRELTAYTSDPAVYARFAGAWIDSALMVLGAEPGAANVTFVRAETGEVTDVDDVLTAIDPSVPADVRWATRVFTARIANGDQGWVDVFTDGLPEATVEIRLFMARLLDTIGRTMRNHFTPGNPADTADQVGQPVDPAWSQRAATMRASAPFN